MGYRFRYFALVIGLWAGLAGLARADSSLGSLYTDDFSTPDEIYSGQVHASDDDIAGEFGNVSYAMETCGATRSVAIRVEHFRRGYPEVAEAIHETIRRGVLYAWHHCPISSEDLSQRLAIDSIHIYLPGGTEAWRASGFGPVTTDVASGESISGTVYDFQQTALYVGDFSEWWDGVLFALGMSSGTFWTVLFLIVLIGVAIWKREALARWYYFRFHPHPAEPIVRGALASGSVLDGPKLARVLGDVPKGNRVLAEVRIAQGELLIQEMQALSRAKVREYERSAAAAYQTAALQSINEAIALAAVALERAKALWRASEGIRNG